MNMNNMISIMKYYFFGNSTTCGIYKKGEIYGKLDLVEEYWEKHLKGVICLGIYPINEQSKCKFLCFDIDGKGS